MWWLIFASPGRAKRLALLSQCTDSTVSDEHIGGFIFINAAPGVVFSSEQHARSLPPPSLFFYYLNYLVRKQSRAITIRRFMGKWSIVMLFRTKGPLGGR
jgi:hypothetical protein